MNFEKNNTKDLNKQSTINNLMTYGKAKGIVLLQKYLPKLNPFVRISVIKDLEEWEKVKDNYPERITQRTDTKIGDPRIVRITGTTGKKEDIPDCIRQIKDQNPDGVLLLLTMKKETIPRYQNDGAFNIAFFQGDSVVIELLGKGFDGGQLTREKAVHERYTIPWNEVLFMRDKYDLQKSREVSKFVVNDEEYQRTRNERVAWLKSIEKDKEAIEEAVPPKYQPTDNDTIKSILDDIVFPLYKRQSDLKRDGLSIFNVQGNIVDGKVEPWEFFRPERLIAKNKEQER